MSDTIRILGLQLNARHGVRHEEKTLTQPFEIDVEITSDLSGAAASDKLEDTIDYSFVVSVVKDVIQGDHCCLIERLAGLIIDRLSEEINEGEITVRVRKPRAPIEVPFKTVEVELRREIKR
ncbi:dihydroneopterin aldolase [Candidatus Latescibacterota bacterium]